MEGFVIGLIAAIFISSAAGYVGSLMVNKKMGVIGGPLGHLALPGVALALLYHFDVFYGALFTIILGGILIWILEIRSKAPIESLTGFVFSFGVALGFLLLPFSDKEALEEALVGNIFNISKMQFFIIIAISLFIIIVLYFIYPKLLLSEISEEIAKVEGIETKKYLFVYLTFITILVAFIVKLVGGLLPVALFVIPSLTSRNLFRSYKAYSIGSLILGGLYAALGILIAKAYSLPSGLMIIIVGSFFFFLSLIKKPQ